MKMLEIGYSTKSIMEIVQISEVLQCRERALESLSNVELLDTYLELFMGKCSAESRKNVW